MKGTKGLPGSTKVGTTGGAKPAGKSKGRSSKLPTGKGSTSFEMGEGTTGVGSRKSTMGRSSGSHK